MQFASWDLSWKVLRKVVITFTAIVIASLSSLWGCVNIDRTSRSHPMKREHAAIKHVLDEQVIAWNRGDINTFMQGYWRSPSLSFSSGGRVTRGWDNTLHNYHMRYTDRQAMGHLTFSDLTLSTISSDVVLVLGSWHLDRELPVGGVFTLIFRKIGHRWQIVHDHTSVLHDSESPNYQP